MNSMQSCRLESDPYLSRVSDTLMRQVRAGTAQYGHTVYSRLGETELAARYLAEFDRLLAMPDSL